MSTNKQIVVAAVILAAVAAGWFGYDHNWFRAAPEIASAGQAPAAAAAPAGNAPGAAGQQTTRRNGATGGAAGGGFGPGRGGPVLVVTDAVTIDTSGIEVRAVGTVAAARAVTIYPQVTGVVTDVSFTPGSAVASGQALLHLDDADEQIALDQARIALASAQSAYDRANQLAQSNNITTVALTDAKTALQKAQIDLKSAELNLAKRTVNAPFGGAVGLSDLSVGDLVTSQKAVATIDDTSTVTVSFSVPERASGLVAIGDKVSATTDALAGQTFSGQVTAVDSRVDPTTRALNVEANLPNNANVLKPGMALTIVLEFPGTPHPAVSSLSIQWDRQGSYVWKVDNGVARRTPVQIVTRRSGVVTVAADLKEADQVVTEGVLRLRDGAQVVLAGSGSGGQQGAGADSGGGQGANGAQRPRPQASGG